MLKIAHRGAKGHAPENTMAAFQKALALQCDGIELDVRLSKDGQVVVFHDHNLSRLCGDDRPLDQCSSWEINELWVSGRERIPFLADVFDLVGPGFLLNIELKVFETAAPVVALIEDYVLRKGFDYRQFLVSSFDWLALQQVRRLHGEIPLGVLTQTDLELAAGFADSIKAETLHPYFHLLNRESVLHLQQIGLKVFAWTANAPEDIERLKSFGVNGIISDFPDRI